jgi:hypothetical protein
LVLVDCAPTEVIPRTNSIFSSSTTPVPLEFVPFQAGSEEFIDSKSFSDWSKSERRPFPSKKSLLQNLLWYYEQIPPGLDIKNPSLVSLIYYLLREPSSRWMLYVLLLNRYSKFHEDSVEKRMNETLETDIIDLQRWRRRARQSVNKIKLAMKFVSLNTPMRRPQEKSLPVDTQLAGICASLLDDYEHLVAELQAYSPGMEFIISMATVMVQFTVARQSTLESVNIRRLTYIALVIAPLGLVTGLFSMSDDFIPGHSKFWIYVVTSTSTVLLVLAISLAIDPSFRGNLLDRKRPAKGISRHNRGKF